jgi:hypothetical protein
MTQKQKYLGLFAILPLLIVVLTSGGMDEAMAEESASVKMSSISQKGDTSYWVIFQVLAGDEALPDGKLLVTSDSQSKEVLYRSAYAGSMTSTSKFLIIADDPSSISAKIVTQKQSDFKLSGEEAKAVGPWVELHTVNQKGDISYELTFHIHAGDEALPDGKLLVTTDSQSREVLFRGVFAGMTASTGQVLISAKDPSSLSVSMQDIELDIDFPNGEKFANKG